MEQSTPIHYTPGGDISNQLHMLEIIFIILYHNNGQNSSTQIFVSFSSHMLLWLCKESRWKHLLYLQQLHWKHSVKLWAYRCGPLNCHCKRNKDGIILPPPFYHIPYGCHRRTSPWASDGYTTGGPGTSTIWTMTQLHIQKAPCNKTKQKFSLTF